MALSCDRCSAIPNASIEISSKVGTYVVAGIVAVLCPTCATELKVIFRKFVAGELRMSYEEAST